MKYIQSACLVLCVLVSGCLKDTGDNWYEADDGSIVYSMCFFKDSFDLTNLTGDARKHRDNVKDKLEHIDYLRCSGLNISIPKGYWYDDTKLLSS